MGYTRPTTQRADGIPRRYWDWRGVMVTGENDHLFDRIRGNAFRQLSRARQKTTNLYLDEGIYSSGEVIGPERQGIIAEQSSILVFADDNPLANFSHEWRYLLYDAQSARPLKEDIENIGKIDAVISNARIIEK